MIRVENVSKTYGDTAALAPTTLDFGQGTTTVLIGPSGCGKSTLLRLLVGLIKPDSGSVAIGDQTLTPQNADALRHRIGYVIQEGGLFPHLTNERNVSLLARLNPAIPSRNGGESRKRFDSAGIEKRVAELAELVRLPRELLDRFPGDLSGGQRQRVGLMRALMLDPEYLLLDEPLGALDPITRFELQAELKAIFERLRKTVILVTHDMGEAAFFGQRIVLMRSGEVVQSGTIDDLLKHPSEPYVTEFIRAQRSPLPSLEMEAVK